MLSSSLEGEPSVRALLGPTNTGKTHRAIERMLEHGTAMIGLPLRLLAREVYDRLTARVGHEAVALVTGEEKRVPAYPRFWVCTVEAMPESRQVDFLAVDEIQLAGHAERGHVFTDRLLHWRGREETWFLGADTMRPLVQRLLPTAVIENRPRLSTLKGVGSLSLGSLPPRSALVAFSTPRVYELAERLRVRRGGAAVVLGALSPRARNAQVALYQAGEVDYMVATDAIGMGLNMDVDTVVFADLRKFDGKQSRELEDAELAQIAGRAGRHHNDGRFGTLHPLPPLNPRVNRAIEQHRFPVVERLYWRNRDLETTSPEALLASLRRAPFDPVLRRMDDAEDFRALEHLARQPEVTSLARGQDRVELLWEVCRIPDFRQLQLDDHFHLQANIYLQLCRPKQRLDSDWMERQITRLDDVQGDMETLLGRMAFIRTWTYITHRSHWVNDAAHWQARTRAIEDRLSDALHQQLVRRFVDGVGTRRRRSPPSKVAEKVSPSPGAPRSLADQLREKLGQGAGPQGLGARDSGRDPWLEELLEAPHRRFRLDESGRIFHEPAPAAGGEPASGPAPGPDETRHQDRPPLATHGGSAVEHKAALPLERLGSLIPGPDILRPDVLVDPAWEKHPSHSLGPGALMRLQRRLLAFSRDLISDFLAPLHASAEAAPSPACRGLLYQLEQSLGTVLVPEARPQIRALTADDRALLKRLGVRLGRHLVYAPALLKGPRRRIRTALWQTFLDRPGHFIPPPAQVSFLPEPGTDHRRYIALGYPVFGGRAIRADVLESVAHRLSQGASDQEIAGHLGCRANQVAPIRAALTGQAQRRTRKRARARG